MLPDLNNPLVVIVGPTAVGKTEISIQLAEKLGGEIVSADSRLFYRGMDIGTAKPTIEERKRVPHHLIDIADPDEILSLAIFQIMAKQAICDIHKRGKIPFLVGGTGQYIKAVVNAWELPVQQPDEKMRSALENWAKEIGPFSLHKKLSILDADAASFIQPQNLRRTIRALEVIFLTGKPFSKQRGKGASPYNLLQIGFTRPRHELYSRIDARIDDMLSNGFIEEVRSLLDKDYTPDLSNLSAIGYREIIVYINGKSSLEGAVIQIKRKTRQFVRRQANWFKLIDPDIHWFMVNDTTVKDVENYIKSGQGWQAPDELFD